ncbi:MAG: hypothetical protein D6828_05705 [Nitrospirae bacterium]|nr:MAG: hypothetical protein D6828_05705 [Nitrospirota bacterium]
MVLFPPLSSFGVEKTSSISDKEIIERLTKLEEGHKNLEKRIDALRLDMNKRFEDFRLDMNRRFDDLRSEMNGKFIDLRSEMDGKFDDLRSEMDGKFDDLRSEMNGRFEDLRSDMNGRFNTIQWMLGLFITIALVILGFVLRMQWQMHKRQSRLEAVLDAQKDEITFIKSLIEKLLPINR